MKRKIGRFHIIYGTVGILLIIALLATSTRGLAQKNYTLYRRAQDIQGLVDDQVWRGVNPSDYPVAINHQDTEYVFYKGKVSKREAVLPILVCTAYKVEGKMNVLMPSYSTLRDLGDFAEGFGNDSQLIKNSYGFSDHMIQDEEYLGTLYHETFHAYQFTNYPKVKHLVDSEVSLDMALILKLDQDKVLDSYYQDEGKTLNAALTGSNSEERIQYAKSYIDQRTKRMDYLQGNLTQAEYGQLVAGETYYELVEGTAFYVYMKTMQLLKGREAYEKYIGSVKELKEKKHKYSQSGMAMGVILDQLGISWKDQVFESELSFYQLFVNEIGE